MAPKRELSLPFYHGDSPKHPQCTRRPTISPTRKEDQDDDDDDDPAQHPQTETPVKKSKQRRRRRHKQSLWSLLMMQTWHVVVCMTIIGVLLCIAVLMLLQHHYKEDANKTFHPNEAPMSHLSTSTATSSTAERMWTKHNFTNQFVFDNNVVHVVNTRLMQLQPNLVDLGMARLEIFQHFCLPTMLNQTSQNFLWIIRTDPLLNPLLKERLLNLVRPYPHYLVVASNDNHEGFRNDVIYAHRIWSGSAQLALQFHEAAQTRVVLESRLDADDGLHRGFIENLQLQALQFTQKWAIFCAYSHLEWQPSSPWDVNAEDDYGYLVALKRGDCITAGLTIGYGIHTQRHDLPSLQHAKLHHTVPPCEYNNNNANNKSRRTKCLVRFGRVYPGAVRARTPTSAGMSGVLIHKFGNRKLYQKNSKRQANAQELLWKGLDTTFSIGKHDTFQMRSYILQHLGAIAKDNLQGQCTKGHSCKSHSQEILKQLVQQYL